MPALLLGLQNCPREAISLQAWSLHACLPIPDTFTVQQAETDRKRVLCPDPAVKHSGVAAPVCSGSLNLGHKWPAYHPAPACHVVAPQASRDRPSARVGQVLRAHHGVHSRWYGCKSGRWQWPASRLYRGPHPSAYDGDAGDGISPVEPRRTAQHPASEATARHVDPRYPRRGVSSTTCGGQAVGDHDQHVSLQRSRFCSRSRAVLAFQRCRLEYRQTDLFGEMLYRAGL